MSTSYFFVRTPIQLYNAIEAKIKFCKETKCNLIILSDYPPTLSQFERLIDSKMWSEVYIPWGKYKTLTKFKLFNRLLNVNRHIDTGFTTQQLTSVGLDDCVVKQDEDAPQVPNTNAMIGLLINAVQVLQDKVKELEKEKVFTLKSHIV